MSGGRSSAVQSSDCLGGCARGEATREDLGRGIAVSRAPRLAFDIGGTFADVIVATAEGELMTFKLLSVPDRVAGDVRARVAEALARSGHERLENIVHGTTIGSNALLEGKGAVTGLITTEGFRDEIELRRLARPGIYDYGWVRTPPLIPRRHRKEVSGRMTAKGEVFAPLDLDEARRALLQLKEAGVESLAICLMNAYANPQHEEALAALARELAPEALVSQSSKVLPAIREYERMSTTCVNAYLAPVVNRYIDALERELLRFGANLRIMQSNGGVMSAEHARSLPVYLVESGPAAGVIGAAALTRQSGVPHAVSFDMGGTTVKACLIENSAPAEKSGMEVGGQTNASTRYSRGAGYAVSVPSIDIVEAGAGGGSIAWIDDAGSLRVGPTSAGASPGPACYGGGGRLPTVTDANVALGYMNPEAIAGGAVPIHRGEAIAAFERELCPRLGMSVVEAAHGVHTVANAAMMRAIRAVTTERGRDPRELALIAFGGAGPIHAAGLAEALGMKRIHVALHPGLFSALGMLLADVRYDHVQSIPGPLRTLDLGGLARRCEEQVAGVREALRREGVDDGALQVQRLLDLRYRGQTSELTLPLPPSTLSLDDLSERFHAEHERSFGYRCPDEPIVVVNLRLKTLAPAHGVDFARIADAFRRAAADRRPSPRLARRAYFGPAHGEQETRILARADLLDGPRDGPLIVEEFDTTVVVPPGWRAALDPLCSIVLQPAD